MLFSLAMTFSRSVGDGIVARFREPLCAETWWGDTASRVVRPPSRRRFCRAKNRAAIPLGRLAALLACVPIFRKHDGRKFSLNERAG
jgi:hypothetical protein